MITENDITEVYNKLINLKQQLFNASTNLATCKCNLEIGISNGLLDGTIEGKNQQLRDASARDVLAEDYAAVDNAQYNYDEIRLEYDLMQLEADKIKLIVRLLELN